MTLLPRVFNTRSDKQEIQFTIYLDIDHIDELTSPNCSYDIDTENLTVNNGWDISPKLDKHVTVSSTGYINTAGQVILFQPILVSHKDGIRELARLFV